MSPEESIHQAAGQKMGRFSPRPTNRTRGPQQTDMTGSHNFQARNEPAAETHPLRRWRLQSRTCVASLSRASIPAPLPLATPVRGFHHPLANVEKSFLPSYEQQGVSSNLFCIRSSARKESHGEIKVLSVIVR